jgi:hypothetical protein
VWYGPVEGIDREMVGGWHPASAAAVAVARARTAHRFGAIAIYAARLAGRHAQGEFRVDEAEWRLMAGLLRDICNPFWPAPAVRMRLPRVIRSIAEAAYEERTMPSGELETARLAVLSDALEEAGYADAAILSHLRSPGPHIRGCWAVDLLLWME